MRSRIPPWFVIVLVIMGVGLAANLYKGSSSSLLIPVILVVIVWLLYKFPPSRWKKPQSHGRSSGSSKNPDIIKANAKAKAERRRSSPFTVIEGRKNKEDEPPRYH
jgi:hypothetical protein